MLKLLLAERVSIRNLHLIIEAIAEIAPHVRRTEQIVEHVRIRMAQQICGDLSEGGVLKVLRLGNRWDLAFHQSLKRDAKGEVRRVRHRSAPARGVRRRRPPRRSATISTPASVSCWSPRPTRGPMCA